MYLGDFKSRKFKGFWQKKLTTTRENLTVSLPHFSLPGVLFLTHVLSFCCLSFSFADRLHPSCLPGGSCFAKLRPKLLFLSSTAGAPKPSAGSLPGPVQPAAGHVSGPERFSVAERTQVPPEAPQRFTPHRAGHHHLHRSSGGKGDPAVPQPPRGGRLHLLPESLCHSDRRGGKSPAGQ